MSDERKRGWLGRLLGKGDDPPPDAPEATGGFEEPEPSDESSGPPDSTIPEGTATIPPPTAGVSMPDSEEIRAAEAGVATTWGLGDRILDLYEVKDVFKTGGMGLVYRVHHLNWNIDLAVKSPRPSFFRTDRQRTDFVRECETWIGLGMHPHTVNCYYVRELGGIPRVFAEFVEGGSLLDWIRKRRLYGDDPEQTVLDIVDIAIQCAWGLEYSHEKGLVHQDFKPANVMMTPRGMAKVTDFGLARAAQAVQEEDEQGSVVESLLVTARGLTPAYCSPEQAGRQRLSLKTDIWSWAVSVLEMFTGEVTWMSGIAAREALETCLTGEAETVVPIPESVAGLLAHCLEQSPDDRPADFGEIAGRLRDAYRELGGEAHARELPAPADLLADGNNNTGVSFIDLGRASEAVVAFANALRADPHHPEASYNQGLLAWRQGRMTDDALLKRLEEVRRSHPGDWLPSYLLGLTHVERGDIPSAVEAFESTPRGEDSTSEVDRALSTARADIDRGGGCLREIEGLPGAVTALSVGADGSVALAGARDRLILLRLHAEEPVTAQFEGHSDEVCSVALSDDLKWAISGSVDQTIRVWHLSSHRGMRTLLGHRRAVNSVKMSPNSRWALSGSSDETVKLWDVAKGLCVKTFRGHLDAVQSVALLPDGRRGISAGADRTIRLWDLSTGRLLRTFEGHRDWVDSIVPGGRGDTIVSASHDETIRIWELATGKCRTVLEGHTGPVNSVSLSHDGSRVVSASDDRTVRLWELATGRCIRTFTDHEGRVKTVRVTPDGDGAVSGSDDRTIRIFRLRGSTVSSSHFVVSFPSSGVELAKVASGVRNAIGRATEALEGGRPGEALEAVAEARRAPGYERHADLVRMWHQAGSKGRREGLRGAWCTADLRGHRLGVSAVDISPTADRVVSASLDRKVKIWDPARGREVAELSGHGDEILDVRFSLDGSRILSASADKTLRLWDTESGRMLRVLTGHTDWVNSGDCGPTGQWALSGSTDGRVALWDLETGALAREFRGHGAAVLSVAFSPDGLRALSGSDDQSLRLWDLATGRCLRKLLDHEDWVNSVAFSPDGLYALSGGGDPCPRLWDLTTGECVRRMEGHRGWINAVAFTPDGRYGISASRDATLRLWDLSTGESLRQFAGHTDTVESVAICGDGRWAVSGSDDHTVRMWNLDWNYRVPDPADWDEGARWVLDSFLTQCCPREEDGFRLTGAPNWRPRDFARLLQSLEVSGYGWLRPAGVRRKLEEMSASWT